MAVNQDILKKQIEKAMKSQGGTLTKSQQATAEKYGIVNPKNTPETTTETTPETTTDPTSEMKSMLEKFTKAQEAQRIAELKQARDTALGTIEQEREQLRPAFREARSGVRGEGRASARNFDEYLATRGLSTSGAAAQGQIAQNVTTQGQLGALGQQEAQAQTDIARREQEIKQGTIDQVLAAGRQRDIDVMGGTMDILGQQAAFAQNEKLAAQSFENQKEIANITAQRQKDLAELNSENQIKYLEKQDELVTARNAGELNPVEIYEAKLQLDRQYGVGQFAPQATQQEVSDYSTMLDGMYNAISGGDYRTAWQEYNRSQEAKEFYNQYLDKDLIDVLKQNISTSELGTGGRMVE